MPDPIDHGAKLRSAAWDITRAANELHRLQENIKSALLIIDHFGQESSPAAIKQQLTRNYYQDDSR